MFTWICPKCGKEVPPSYDECPNCSSTGQTAAQTTAQEHEIAGAPPRVERGPSPVATAPPPAAAMAQPASKGMPGWATTLLVAVAFVAILFGLFTVLRTRSGREAAQNAQAAPVDSLRLPDPAAVKAHPLLKSLELTGLRLTEDAKQKAQLDFVLVNHSAADIAGLTANATLVAVNGKPGDPAMATFTFKTDLAPYEAKDMKVPVKTRLRAYELPDWQFLRADVEITAP